MMRNRTAQRMRRVVLGTVQLGLPYGRRANEVVLPVAEAWAILDRAWELGVRAFDTAEAYGESAERLAAWIASRGVHDEVEVITKVRASDPPERVGAALGRYQGVASRTVLSHGAAQASRWSTFITAAQEAGALAGQSVYTRDEVAAAVLLQGVARVQAPGNIFDRAALDARGDAPVALDVRSVYLPGVLLVTPERAECRAVGAGALAAAVSAGARAVGNAPSVMLVAAALAALRDEDRVVLGVDAPEQLGTLEQAIMTQPQQIERFEQEVRQRCPEPPPAVLDPRTWRTLS
jgi:hypothetical protein